VSTHKTKRLETKPHDIARIFFVAFDMFDNHSSHQVRETRGICPYLTPKLTDQRADPIIVRES